MKISFSPPYIDDDITFEILDTLKSGWITTGPKVRDLEKLCAEFVGVKHAICVNSWTSGAALVLKWLGIGPGDEVIVPAYTYSATALAVLHTGAKVVMVDVLDDFTIDPAEVAKHITPATKAVFAVDIAGWPCNYTAVRNVLNASGVKQGFRPHNTVQASFGRPVLLSDAAHSLGATYENKPAALASDITIYSLHAVKNITTAEGGVICLNLPAPFIDEEVYRWMKLNSLNGQTKDAFAKTQLGGWKYDIVSQGLKINMPDLCAALGLAQLRKYGALLLPERERVQQIYVDYFKDKDWAIVPPYTDDERNSSCHLFPLRIKGISEDQRDAIIQDVAENGVSTNVHFIPLPMLSLFKGLGFKIADYPSAYRNYACEISLPIYPQLTDAETLYVAQQVDAAYCRVVGR
jgi:dTDP-4-amino-4,6-dideoxygalactose transaminase